jgi:hypothetical protein
LPSETPKKHDSKKVVKQLKSDKKYDLLEMFTKFYFFPSSENCIEIRYRWLFMQGFPRTNLTNLNNFSN